MKAHAQRTVLTLLAALAVSGIAFGAQPIAAAEAPELDQAAYDKCRDDLASGVGNGTINANDITYRLHKCCQDAGGTPTQNGSLVTCAQPAMSNPGNGTPTTKPGVTVPRVPDVGVSVSNPTPTTTPGPIVPPASVNKMR